MCTLDSSLSVATIIVPVMTAPYGTLGAAELELAIMHAEEREETLVPIVVTVVGVGHCLFE